MQCHHASKKDQALDEHVTSARGATEEEKYHDPDVREIENVNG
jgi:hypothetical protein